MKRSFFQAAFVSILLYGCTTWTLTKRLEKKLDGNYTRMLRAILNKSWWQHLTKHQLYGHLPSITKTIQVRRTRHAGHCWKSDVLLWTPTYSQAKAGRLARTYSSYVRIRDVVLKTCRRRWTIGRSGEIGSGISVLAAQHDDDEWQSDIQRKLKYRKILGPCQKTKKRKQWKIMMTVMPIVVGALGTVPKAWNVLGKIGNQRKNQDHPN